MQAAAEPHCDVIPVTIIRRQGTFSVESLSGGVECWQLSLNGLLRAICRTYGKGLIQSVYQLEDGSALVVTIGKYLTPARIDIDREGLRPDFGTIPDRATADARLAACKARIAA